MARVRGQGARSGTSRCAETRQSNSRRGGRSSRRSFNARSLSSRRRSRNQLSYCKYYIYVRVTCVPGGPGIAIAVPALRLPPRNTNATIKRSMSLDNLRKPQVGIPWRTRQEESRQQMDKLRYYFDRIREA